MDSRELKIEDVAFGGKGIGRHNGKAIFIPFTIEGEVVLAELVREKKQFAEAELVDVLKASPDRVQPPCPYFGRSFRRPNSTDIVIALPFMPKMAWLDFSDASRTA